MRSPSFLPRPLRSLWDAGVALHRNTSGAEAVEAIAIMAFVVPPVVEATRLVWVVFLRFFSGAVAVVNAPIF